MTSVETSITTIRITSVAELEPFAEMAMRHHIAAARPFISDPRVVAVGAFVDGIPAGLLLCVIDSKHNAEIRSVFVVKQYRRRGVASALIQTAEKIVEESGIEAIILGVNVPSESTPIRNVIAKRGWNAKPRRLRCLLSICGPEMRLAEAPWRKKQLRNSDIEVFPWDEVTTDELRTLADAGARDDCWFPIKLSPLVDNTYLYRPFSIGLRYKGELIGWSIAHRFADGPVNFSIMFARAIPEYPLAGLHLLQKTADRLIEHAEHHPPTSLRCAIVDGNKFFEFMERKVFAYLPTETSELDTYCREFCPQQPVLNLNQTQCSDSV